MNREKYPEEYKINIKSKDRQKHPNLKLENYSSVSKEKETKNNSNKRTNTSKNKKKKKENIPNKNDINTNQKLLLEKIKDEHVIGFKNNVPANSNKLNNEIKNNPEINEEKKEHKKIIEIFYEIKKKQKNAKVFSFYDMCITKKKIILKEDIKKKQMILNMQKEIDYMLIQCNIEMDQKQLKNEDMIQIITEEINKLKNIQKINTENQNQKNEEKMNKIEAKLKIIENEREKEKEEIHQMKTNWDNKEKELKNQIKELQEVIKNMKIIIGNNNKYIEEIKKIQKAKLEEGNGLWQIKEFWLLLLIQMMNYLDVVEL